MKRGRFMKEDLTLINLLQEILYNNFGSESSFNIKLETHEQKFMKELKKYTKNIMKQKEKLKNLDEQEFNLEIEQLACELINCQDELCKCAMECGCHIGVLIILKCFNI